MSTRPSRKRKSEEEESPNKKIKMPYKWEKHSDTLHILNSSEIKPSTKVIGFDMDDTIITPKSGAKFAKGRKDWVWLNDSIQKKLKDLNEEGYKIVIFTNQAGIEKGKTKLRDIQGKIEDVMNELGFCIQAFVAAGTDQFRKPNNTMWEIFEEKYNGGITLEKAMYIGDAAGRKKDWKSGMKKDFSCSDRKFANNSGIDFQTPEEFFLNETATKNWTWGETDPKEFLKKYSENELPDIEPAEAQEMIIMVGVPASGKSTFSKKFAKFGYEVVNRDTLKTVQKCEKVAREALENGKSVVVDNTNPGVSARAGFIAIAKEKRIPVRCFHINTDIELVKHLNLFRERTKNVRRIPDVAYNMFKKNFKKPDFEEGIQEIIEIDFVPEFDKKDEKYFIHRY
eukprot:gene5881-9709_t